MKSQGIRVALSTETVLSSETEGSIGGGVFWGKGSEEFKEIFLSCELLELPGMAHFWVKETAALVTP